MRWYASHGGAPVENQTYAPPQLAVKVIEADSVTVLKVQSPEAGRPQHWMIGRESDCAVRIADTWVSAHHLLIRAEPMQGPHSTNDDGSSRYLWMFKDYGARDLGTTNGTYQGGILVGKRGHPRPWIVIEDDDSLLIGQTHLRFSFDGHFTSQGGDTDNADGKVLAAETPSDIKPPKPHEQGDVVSEILEKEVGLWDVVLLLLTGPRDRANWQWWMFLATVGSTLAVALEWVRHR